MVYLIDIASDIGSLQSILQQVHDRMIVHCSELIRISSAIAGFGTLWFVMANVWVRLGRAEPIVPDQLLRPFAIAIAILFFPNLVIGVIDGVMKPIAEGTAAIVNDSNQAVATLLQKRQDALTQSADWQMYVNSSGSGDLDKWEELSGQADSGFMSGLSNRVKFEMAKGSYNMKNSIRVWLSEILQVLFESASLCINTVRTFYMIVLAILGPMAFAFSVYKGLEDSISNWLSRYLQVFLWLPVTNIFGSLLAQIQQEMIKQDLDQLAKTGQTMFGPTDAAYFIFLIMGIAGYFTVPSVTNYIIRAGGMGAKLWRKQLT